MWTSSPWALADVVWSELTLWETERNTLQLQPGEKTSRTTELHLCHTFTVDGSSLMNMRSRFTVTGTTEQLRTEAALCHAAKGQTQTDSPSHQHKRVTATKAASHHSGMRTVRETHLTRRRHGSLFTLLIVLRGITPTRRCHHFTSRRSGGRRPLATTWRWRGGSKTRRKKRKKKGKMILIHTVLLLHVHQELKSEKQQHDVH